MELRIEYTMGVSMRLEIPESNVLEFEPPRPNSMLAFWEEGIPSQGYGGGTISIRGTMYDLDRVIPMEEDEETSGRQSTPWGWILAILLIAAVLVGGWTVYKKRKQ
jgi:hypothetical protein